MKCDLIFDRIVLYIYIKSKKAPLVINSKIRLNNLRKKNAISPVFGKSPDFLQLCRHFSFISIFFPFQITQSQTKLRRLSLFLKTNLHFNNRNAHAYKLTPSDSPLFLLNNINEKRIAKHRSAYKISFHLI